MAGKRNRNRKTGFGGWLILVLVVWGIYQLGGSIESPPSASTINQPALSATTPRPQATPSENTTAPSLISPTTAEVRYVTASSLNLRASPGTDSSIVSGLPTGVSLRVVEGRGEWLRVHADGGLSGWVHGGYTSTIAPVPRLAARPVPQAPPTSSLPADRPRSEIVQLLIARSINSYSGSCACPYNVDRGGRRCGGRSAYSKPRGASPLCYEGDITEAMISAFME